MEVVHALDFLIIRCQERLRGDRFAESVLLSLYIVFSIRAGDPRLERYALWPHFSKFVDAFELLPLEQINQLKAEIGRCFWEYRMGEVLSDIPLGFTFQKLMKRNEQFYIPKIETIL